MAKLTVTISMDDLTADDLANIVPVDKGTMRASSGLCNAISKVAAGTRTGYFEVETGTDFSSATVTCDQASAVAATDDLTIGTMTFASVASSPTVTSGEWEIGSSDSAMATNLAAAINGLTANAGVVTASSSAAIVTLTFNSTGAAGDEIALAKTGSGLTLSGANPTGGTGGDSTRFARGAS